VAPELSEHAWELTALLSVRVIIEEAFAKHTAKPDDAVPAS
jgi:hypothetical protein